MEAHDDRRTKDLLRAGDLDDRAVVGDPTWVRLTQGRLDRRPAGSSVRLWQRLTGEDPFETGSAELTRRTVYADARVDRLDKPSQASSSPDPAARRPRRPSSDSGNQGEALIPAGFRNLPAAPRPAPATPKQAAPPPPPLAPEPAPPPRVSASGRYRTAPTRMRTVIRTPHAPEAPPQPTPSSPPATPPPAPKAVEVKEPGLDDLFDTPLQGRARMRRAPPTKPQD